MRFEGGMPPVPFRSRRHRRLGAGDMRPQMGADVRIRNGSDFGKEIA
jgi:hypothetical protein